MIFNTLAYFLLFLVPAALLFRLLPPGPRPWVCVGFGALFFVYFSLTESGGAVGAACLALFAWEALCSRLYRPGSVLCLLGVAQSVLILAVFKYWNFLTGLVFGAFEGAFEGALEANPLSNPLQWDGAFLPLGISFFTFEFIHYALDRYHDRTRPGTLGQYLAFILFFPTMVAGPIKRYQDFLPKLEAPSTDWRTDWERGTTRILCGLAKKFVLADTLTALTGHLNQADLAGAHRAILPVWLLAYGLQVYFDFSAYSDIAIGSTRLFGIQVPENFDWPYLCTNIAEFWRHWHISLSQWLTDYVYIPLGGSRRAPVRVYMNLLATMLVSGIWHGAGLHFVVWGLWHGGLLALHRLWSRWRGPREGPPSRAGQVASWALTFVLVNLGWAFFCMDLPTARFFFRRLLLG